LVLLPDEKKDVRWSKDGCLVGMLEILRRDALKCVLQLWGKDLKDRKKQFDNVERSVISPDDQYIAFLDGAITYITDTATSEQVAVANKAVHKLAFNADSTIMTYIESTDSYSGFPLHMGRAKQVLYCLGPV
jgi:hypothetical protein